MADVLPPINLPAEALPWAKAIEARLGGTEAVAAKAAQRVEDQSVTLAGTTQKAATTGATTRAIQAEPAAPTNVTAIPLSYWDSDGAGRGTIYVTWTWVTQTANGVPINVDTQEVWYRPSTSDQFLRATAGTDLSATINALDVGTYFVKVRGVSQNGVAGSFSQPIQVDVATPTTTPGAPSTPTLVSQTNSITATWDGLISGVPMPAWIKSVRLWRSTSIAGTYVAVGAPLVKGGTIVMEDVTPGVTYYFKLQSESRTGVLSNFSAVSSIVCVGIDTVDFATGLQANISNSFSNANAAFAQANSAFAQANSAFGQANSAFGQANTAYGAANSAASNAAAANTAAAAAQARADAILATSPEMMTNPGFERDFADWTLEGTPTISTTALRVHSGQKAAGFAANAGEVRAIKSQLFDTAPGRRYRVTWWLYGTSTTGQPNLRIWDATDTQIGSLTVTPPNPANQFNKNVFDFTIPAGYTQFKIRFAKGDSSGTYYLDDISLLDITDAYVAQQAANDAANAAAAANTLATAANTLAAGANTVATAANANATAAYSAANNAANVATNAFSNANAAANLAANANTLATTANTKATAADANAVAANTLAATANTKATAADANAVAANTLATTANAAAAAAKLAADSAAIADGSVSNPIFANWAGANPDGFSVWTTPGLIKETALARTKPNAVRMVMPDTATQGGLQFSTGFLPNAPYNDYWTITVDFYLVSGALGGAGVVLDWTGLSNNRASIALATEVPSPLTGRWYTVTKTVRIPTGTHTGTYTGMAGYLMGTYSPLLGTGAAKDIIYDRLVLRPATTEEVRAINAETVATAANTLAGAANTLATTANTKATAADSNATAANTLATTANTKATAADANAVAANTLATTANTKATAADSNAQAANTLATTANTKATAADANAVAANTLATTANGTATSAYAQANSAYNQANAANTNAATALTAANGKNKVVWSTLDASGTAGYVAGDTWFKESAAGTGNVIGQWRYTGTAWVSRPIGNEAIAYIDAAKINTGYLDVANRIQANSINGNQFTANTLFARTAIIPGSLYANEAVFPGSVTGNLIQGNAIDGMTITGALIRTGTTNPRVQLDSYGFHGFAANGAEATSVGTDGKFVAVDAQISGTYRTSPVGSGRRIEIMPNAYVTGTGDGLAAMRFLLAEPVDANPATSTSGTLFAAALNAQIDSANKVASSGWTGPQYSVTDPSGNSGSTVGGGYLRFATTWTGATTYPSGTITSTADLSSNVVNISASTVNIQGSLIQAGAFTSDASNSIAAVTSTNDITITSTSGNVVINPAATGKFVQLPTDVQLPITGSATRTVRFSNNAQANAVLGDLGSIQSFGPNVYSSQTGLFSGIPTTGVSASVTLKNDNANAAANIAMLASGANATIFANAAKGLVSNSNVTATTTFLVGGKSYSIPRVANTTQRTAFFPSPVVGDRVIRTDNSGILEKYNGTAWVNDLQDTGWLTLPLGTGWSYWGTPYSQPQYKILNGVVYVRGLIAGASGTATNLLFTLPAGARPTGESLWYGASGVGNGTAEIDLKPNGTATVISYGSGGFGVGSGGYIELDGIFFAL